MSGAINIEPAVDSSHGEMKHTAALSSGHRPIYKLTPTRLRQHWSEEVQPVKWEHDITSTLVPLYVVPLKFQLSIVTGSLVGTIVSDNCRWLLMNWFRKRSKQWVNRKWSCHRKDAPEPPQWENGERVCVNNCRPITLPSGFANCYRRNGLWNLMK